MPQKKQTLISIVPRDVYGSTEDLLLTAWEGGFLYLTSVDTRIRSRDIKGICTLFSIPTAKELTKKSYWEKALRKKEGELERLLIKNGYTWNSKTKNVPKGSIKLLQTEAINVRATIKEMKAAAITPKKVEKLGPPKLEWRDIGFPPPSGNMRLLSEDEIESIHFLLASDFAKQNNPISPAGVRDHSMLGSAVFRPQTSYGVDLKYPTIQMAAAALLHSLINNHPFHNGNKRTALVSMVVMLDENGVMFQCADDELFDKLVDIAKHEIAINHPKYLSDRETLEIADWIDSHSRAIRNGDRTLPYRKLKPILIDHNCKIGTREFGKIQITRTHRSGALRTPKQHKFILHCKTDGRDVSQREISKLRKALCLDESNGVDSAVFYETDTAIVEGFIRTYRKTLQRLSKV